MDAHHATITLCVATAAGGLLVASADALRVPSIVLLLLGGIVLGPEVLGWIQPATLGQGLETVVGVAVAVILFEGGLTLDVDGFRRAPAVIVRMLTVGVLITWFGAALAAHLAFGMSPSLSVLMGSLVIVTGPTVVSPILRRLRVRPRLHHVLYWEGVLIDAVGVFAALSCFEWIAASQESALDAGARFGLRIVTGAGLGLAAGVVMSFVLRRDWIGREHMNIVVLASALLVYGIANSIVAEAGILAVITTGLVMAIGRSPTLRGVRRFKLELTEIGIGLLFILLAAKLDLARFGALGWRLAAFLIILTVILRPLNVLASTWGRDFTRREKLLLCWLAPRGVVAASMASLVALRLEALGNPQAWYFETITYAVIGTTVLLQGLAAPLVARVLGVRKAERGAWLLAGDPPLVTALQRGLREAGVDVLVLGSNTDQQGSSDSVTTSPLDPTLSAPSVADVEALLAVSADAVENAAAWREWTPRIGAGSCYSLTEVVDGPIRVRPRVVWDVLGGPEAIAGGLAIGISVIEVVDARAGEDDRDRFGPSFAPLFWVRGGQAILVTDPLASAAPEGDTAIVLRRRIAGLRGLVESATILDPEIRSLDAAVAAVLKVAAETSPDLDVPGNLERVRESQLAMPTALGAGVAVPHCYDPAVVRSRCFLGLSRDGLDHRGPDGEPVRLVFVLVSPAGNARDHLAGLAVFAQVAADGPFVQQLAKQTTTARLLAVMRQRE